MLRNFISAVKSHTLYRLVVQTMTYGFGTVVQRVLSLLLLPIYTRYLTTDDYGIFGLLSVSSVVLTTITSLALTNGISRYFYYPDQENTTLEAVVWSPIFFIIGFSLLLLIPLGFVAEPLSNLLFDSSQYTYVVILTLAGILVSNLASVGQSILIFQEKAMLVNILNIINVVIGVVFGLFFVVYLQRGVTGLVESVLLTSVVMLFPNLMLSAFRFKPSFSYPTLLKQIRYSLPLVGALAAFFIFDSSDRYFLKVFQPLSEVGIYNIGYNFGLVVMILVGGFSSAWPPYYHKNNQQGEGQTICNDVLKVYLLVLSACVILISLAAPLILRLFTTAEFFAADSVVPWVSMAYMLQGPYIIFLMGVLIKNKTSWQLLLEFVAAGVNVLGNLLLIPIFGREAAAFTTLLSYGTLALGAYWMVQRINPIPGISKGFIAITVGAVLVATSLATFSYCLHWNYAWTATLILVVYLGAMLPVSIREFWPLILKWNPF